jgi:hypothetical protein
VVRYVYDLSGNRTSRTVLPGAHAEYDIDEVNRIRGQVGYFANNKMGAFGYSYDEKNRHRSEQRMAVQSCLRIRRLSTGQAKCRKRLASAKQIFIATATMIQLTEPIRWDFGGMSRIR